MRKVRNQPRQTGTVKLFNPGHGFGFITPDAGGNDVFFDHNAVAFANLGDRIEKGFRIIFDAVPDPKRGRGSYTAVNLSVDGEETVEIICPKCQTRFYPSGLQ
jgi:CspA family cold shock protein